MTKTNYKSRNKKQKLITLKLEKNLSTKTLSLTFNLPEKAVIGILKGAGL